MLDGARLYFRLQLQPVHCPLHGPLIEYSLKVVYTMVYSVYTVIDQLKYKVQALPRPNV